MFASSQVADVIDAELAVIDLAVLGARRPQR
jgi:hypothetical protein